MMWFNQNDKTQKIRSLNMDLKNDIIYNSTFLKYFRHWCDRDDNLTKYGWTAHDGRNFGIHDVYESHENSYTVRNSWAKRVGGSYGGEWTVRTDVNTFNNNDPTPKFVSVIFYVAKNYTGWIKTIDKNSNSFSGETEDLGRFKFRLTIDDKTHPNVFTDMTIGNSQVTHLKENLLNNQHFKRIVTKSETFKEYVGLRGFNKNEGYERSNFIAIQVTGQAPFTFDFTFESESYANEYRSKNNAEPKEFRGQEFDNTLQRLHGDFQNKFERIFKLREHRLQGNAIMMAQSTLSNLIGGIGFFTGRSIVKSEHSKEPLFYWESNLYTAVPSRSFFPRGFLWDEGFHQILISEWDDEISKDIMSHWLDLMNVEGWIPR